MAHAPRKRANPHDPTTAAFNVPGSLAERLRRPAPMLERSQPARARHPDAMVLESLDDLVSPHQQRLRDRHPQRLRGLEVDDEFEFSGLLDRQIARLGTFEDFVYVARGASGHRVEVRSIAEQSALLRPRPPTRREQKPPLPGRLDDSLAVRG